jgi:hypothetical protein
MSAIRKLAAEAADNGLLATELAAGISRVKSAKTQGIRVGNWLSLRQAPASPERARYDHAPGIARSRHSKPLRRSSRRAWYRPSQSPSNVRQVVPRRWWRA